MQLQEAPSTGAAAQSGDAATSGGERGNRQRGAVDEFRGVTGATVSLACYAASAG